MYRYITPASEQELPLRMLFQPMGGPGFFHRACEADSFRGLTAALLDDPDYERSDMETRLVHRLRLAHEMALLSQLDARQLTIDDRDGTDVINVSTDERFIRSLNQLAFVSLSPSTDGGL